MSVKCDCGHVTDESVTIERPSGKTILCRTCALVLLERMAEASAKIPDARKYLEALRVDLEAVKAQLNMELVEHWMDLHNQVDKAEGVLDELVKKSEGR